MFFTRMRSKKQALNLWLAATRGALPGVPVTKQFELLVKASLFDEELEVGARKALAERFSSVGDSPGRQRREHGVQFQLPHIHLIQSVRSGVIIRQVVGLFLIGHQRRHALEQEIKIVRTERSII